MSRIPTQQVYNRGANSILQVAGGDFVLEQNVFTQAPDFFEPNLEYVEPPTFESPCIAEELTVSLSRRQILILGGPLQEKSTLAHHLAWCLLQKLDSERSSDNGDGDSISIREWIQHAGPARIQTALRSSKTRSLFILPQIQPHQVEHDPGKLGIDARKNGHYILATTDVPRERWTTSSQENLDPFWRELETAAVYPPLYLGHFLRKELDRSGEPLPDDLFPDGAPQAFDDLERYQIGDLSFLEAARRLGTPDRIRSLVQWLTASSTKPPNAARLRQYIEHLEGDQTAIAGWYRNLEQRQQLLALGLTMLDGLLDDQLFAALEILVEKVWRPRVPSLASFDYHDLDALSGYFRRTPTRAGGIKVECNSYKQRQALLTVAWGLHRRQIIAAIPMLTEVIKAGGEGFGDSTEKYQGRARKLGQVASEATENLQHTEGRREKEENDGAETSNEDRDATGRREDLYISRWQGYGPESELYGSRHRQRRFFVVMSDFLSHLGLLSLETVERCFLELASDPIRDVQVVAAKAMARWREHDEHEKLFFRTLHHWQNEASTKERIARLFSGRRGFPPSPYANVRATIALAVSYASLHDPPNKLSPQLRRLLEKLARDRHPVVRSRLRDQVLPFAVARHRRQLDPYLKELARYTDLMSSIAFGWALACQADPGGSWELLDAWIQENRGEPPTPPRVVATVREARLAVAALTYGYLDYQISAAPVSVEGAGQRLRRIFEEKHPFLRRRVLQAMVLQAGRSLRSIDRQIRELLQSVGLKERDLLLKPLERTYLDQRAGLGAGDKEILIDGRFYSIWTSRERPRTEVEEVLYDWLEDSEHPVAQQIAWDALTRFRGSKVDHEELRLRIETDGESPLGSDDIEADADDGPILALRPTAWIDQLAIAIITRGDSNARGRLKAPVAELREQAGRHGAESERLVDELRDAGATSADLGRYLKRYLFYHRHRSVFHAGTLILAVALGLLISVSVLK